MRDLTIGWDEILRRLHPDTLLGAAVYLVIAVLVAQLLSRTLRIAVAEVCKRESHLDRTTVSFLQQFGIVVTPLKEAGSGEQQSAGRRRVAL